MSSEGFQDGRHGNSDLYVAPMPPIKFRLNLTYGFGGDIIWRISRWPLSWILERNNFSNSESLCHCDTSHQVLAESNLRFGRRCRLKNFKMATMDIWTEQSLQFWNSMSLPCLPNSFSSIWLMVLEKIKKKTSKGVFRDNRCLPTVIFQFLYCCDLKN